MATVLFLTDEEEQQLYDIGILGASGSIILVTPNGFDAIVEELNLRGDSAEIKDFIFNSSAALFYDCGGDADKWLDVCDSKGHYFISMLEDEKIKDELDGYGS